ncbi:peptide-methionine (S)-S-oxide reductase MsrA [Pedobacter sp. L105]|uniref:peptide-methionine (S)-S-oxide reductase MsrA n=1 Tax=Pedobacter sp. L105 TaxID=1641871 RepID=UPI00131E0509|nr:peptide-methionine (S)-S-oxide reductase MsrA [Pedobacter sp. L105]
MKAGFFLLSVALFLNACSGSQKIASNNGFAVLPKPTSSEAVATFAGGCFWAMQESLFQLKGVNTVISGYAGGSTVDPTYAEVSMQNTGHAESVQVYYNPQVISYEELLRAFFFAHNPTELNRQGPDVGPEYRSIAFYRNPQELKSIYKVMSKMQAEKDYNGQFVTEAEQFGVFYPAESSHQDYYERNPWDPYIRSVSRPKVLHVRAEMPQLIKAEYLK